MASCRTGTSSENLCFFPNASSVRCRQVLVVLARDQGWIAPSFSFRPLFGTISSGSSYIFTPRPVQSGQAPCGLLKLKLRGAISPRLIPHTTQAKCSE